MSACFVATGHCQSTAFTWNVDSYQTDELIIQLVDINPVMLEFGVLSVTNILPALLSWLSFNTGLDPPQASAPLYLLQPHIGT